MDIESRWKMVTGCKTSLLQKKMKDIREETVTTTAKEIPSTLNNNYTEGKSLDAKDKGSDLELLAIATSKKLKGPSTSDLTT